ncbi:MAG: TIGR00282 family metallophosphoesterase [Peptococcaceae bacterium]|nr:TIGR00282 family metallophosphoesterase [Peptococcaceae bacterium]
MNVLFIGDVVGRPGREAIQTFLPSLCQEYALDFVVANGENAAGGRGITQETAQSLYELGVDFLTLGNHTWDQRSLEKTIDEDMKIIRPANYPSGVPGRGYGVVSKNGVKLGVINLAGRIFLTPLDNPFRIVGEIINKLKEQTPVILVDLHAEATSEKNAMGHFLDGRVSAVVGTHTHIQTADERILSQGTGYITDVGMTGPTDSVIGVKKESVIRGFLTQMPFRHEVASGPIQLEAVVLAIDECGRARSIERVQRYRE